MKKWLMVLMCLCCLFGLVTLSACGGADGPGDDGVEDSTGPPDDAPEPTDDSGGQGGEPEGAGDEEGADAP